MFTFLAACNQAKEMKLFTTLQEMIRLNLHPVDRRRDILFNLELLHHVVNGSALRHLKVCFTFGSAGEIISKDTMEGDCNFHLLTSLMILGCVSLGPGDT